MIRETATISHNLLDNNKVEIIRGQVSKFTLEQIKELVKDCDAVVCCLGHNINFKGIFGPPYNLVSQTVKKITKAILPYSNTKFILMSTTAYTNKKIGEKNILGEKIIFSFLKLFLPPHRDNMDACDYLLYKLGAENNIDWIAVRPDSLIDETSKSAYEVFELKKRSPIFNPGKTSRINVSQFIADLIMDKQLWSLWNHNTPVIYNQE